MNTQVACPVNEIIALDIGCGISPYNVYFAKQLYGIDIFQKHAVQEFKIRDWLNKPMDMQLAGYSYCDLSIDSIPFSDNYFDRISAIDVLEHIPRVIYCPGRKFSFVDAMSEIYRCLKPGGEFFSCTPFYPHGEAFSDPTHVNIITPQTFDYFTSNGRYGFEGEFEILSINPAGCKLHVKLKKPQRIAEPLVFG